MNMYRKEILEHYRNPRNFGRLKEKSKSTHGENPSCGDQIDMDISFENGIVKNIKFRGEGCSIAIASASMLTEKVKGMDVRKIADLDYDFIKELLKIEINPARKRCAMLPLVVLKKLALRELKKMD